MRVEHLWGTAITVDVRERCSPDLVADVFAWFQRVDDLFSTWRPDTEISRLGRRELHLSEVSPEVRAVLELCDRVNEESHGAFDVRVGADPRVAPREGLGPLDPSGLVKGWALQRAAEQLRQRGLTSFAINAGGDVITAGQPGVDDLWRVGIQHPWQRDKVALVVAVSDVGVATSGRYERGDHIIDPSSGAPAIGLQSATVVHEDLALADGYATAALVLGERGPAWLAELDLAGMTIANDATVTTTATFERHRPT